MEQPVENGNTSEHSAIKVEDVLKLAQTVFKFSRIERAIYHEDGIRKETDSDHTVMLGIIACSLAKELRPDLDLGLIAQYSFAHDIVEVHAGDTVTIGISESEKNQKKIREAAALVRLVDEFGETFPWLTDTIKIYEAQEDIESRWVRAVDKLLPRLTHILNNGKIINEWGFKEAGIRLEFERQKIEMSEYTNDLPEIMRLLDDAGDVFRELMFSKKSE